MSKITALLQRLLAMLPFRRKPDAEADTAESGQDDATPAPAENKAAEEPGATTEVLAPEDAEADMEVAIERARKRLVWKKRIIIAVPALLLVIIIVSAATLFLGSSDDAEEQHEAASTGTAHPEAGDGATPATTTDHPAAPVAAPSPTDPQERAKALEAELKKMEQERNALLIEKNALAERNRKLQEAAARRATTTTTSPRSRSPLPATTNPDGTSSTGDTAASDAPLPSVDCTIGGDLETAGELLKRCIEEFNAASEGR